MIRVKRLSGKVLTVLVVFALVLFPLFSGTIAAKPLTTPRGAITTVAPDVASALMTKAIESSRFQELNKKYDFDQSNTLIQKYSINDQDIISISVPIKDNTGENYSKYIMLYDSYGNYVDSILFAFHKSGKTYDFIVQNDHKKAEANIARDGSLLSGTLTDEDGQHDLASFMQHKDVERNNTPNPLVSLLSPAIAYAGWWDCFNSCLASQGVPSWVITGVSIACSIICIASATTLCAQCIIVALAGWGSIGMTCAEHCWGWY
ncbi:MAG: hypothetical protein STSR0004_11980 [Peptococcaceae bacterium]